MSYKNRNDYKEDDYWTSENLFEPDYEDDDGTEDYFFNDDSFESDVTNRDKRQSQGQRQYRATRRRCGGCCR